MKHLRHFKPLFVPAKWKCFVLERLSRSQSELSVLEFICREVCLRVHQNVSAVLRKSLWLWPWLTDNIQSEHLQGRRHLPHCPLSQAYRFSRHCVPCTLAYPLSVH